MTYILYICSSLFSLTAFTGFETNNRYEVKNTMGQKVYFAGEGQYLYITAEEIVSVFIFMCEMFIARFLY